MSGNPFRRSSLKGPGAGSPPSFSPGPVPAETSAIPIPLSLDTGAKTTSQTTKHVAFRSPPALPLSPDSPNSYPPSPISARISPGSSAAVPLSGQVTTLGEAYPEDPFDSKSSEEADDWVLNEARHNAQTNLGSSVQGATTAAPQDPVQTTLGKFASMSRTSTGGKNVDKDGAREPHSRPQTMDVDAFARMLLTGANASQGSKEATSQGTPMQIPSASESSSSTDTASISHQSIFEPMPPIPADSPRTSQELDEDEADDERQLMAKDSAEVKKKPQPPKPRHGKLIKHNVPSSVQTQAQQSSSNRLEGLDITASRPRTASDLNKALPLPPVDTTFPEGPGQNPKSDVKLADNSRRPPTPPLARRRSSQKQASNPTLSRSSSSRQPFAVDTQNPSSSPSLSLGSKPPPPPPSRRQTANFDRRPSADTVSISEDVATQSQLAENAPTPLPSSDSTARPPLPPSRNPSANQPATSSQTMPPPLPPPRRTRGTSKNSFDMQRPSLTATPMPDADAKPSVEGNRNVSGPSNASDILADLVALQKELDAIRARAGN